MKKKYLSSNKPQFSIKSFALGRIMKVKVWELGNDLHILQFTFRELV